MIDEKSIVKFDEISPLLEAIISYIDEGVIISDFDGRVLYHNPAAAELLGLKSGAKLGNLRDIDGLDLSHEIEISLKDIAPPRTGARYDEHFSTFDREVKIHGQCRFLQFNSCQACESQGHVRLLIIKDRTQQTRLDALLKRSRDDLITSDPAMLEVLTRLEQVAPTDASVLLQGESGTGKTHIARLIHRLSRRADKPFVEVNCAAIPETLLESELFGHIKGAFTGATRDRPGRFLAADKGTLFLDEVGEIPLHLQAKLLRVIQDMEFEPVGSDKTRKVDVRIISSSNKGLRCLAESGEFRADLYYRLAVIPLYVPAIRERKGDIPLLLDYFSKRLRRKGGFSDAITCSHEAMQLMLDYPWPGNVRELENAVEHAMICAVDHKVLPESLPEHIRNYRARAGADGAAAAGTAGTGNGQAAAVAASVAGGSVADQDERREIEAALRQAKGNKTQAARLLGIDRTTLWRKMRRLNM